MSGNLAQQVAAEMSALAGAVPEAIKAFAAALAEGAAPHVAGVLFYGSALRSGDLDGVLDFYVITDRLVDWPMPWPIAAASYWLPPYVEYREVTLGGLALRAKVAVLGAAQFATLVRAERQNTTVWARFSQPVALVWQRDAAAAAALQGTVAQAVATAAGWAHALGPAEGDAADYWRALYGRTYRVELRVERHNARALDIVAAGGERYERFLPLAWDEMGLPFRREASGRLARTGPTPAPFRGWWQQVLAGKPLSIARLVKAAFTFRGGPAYIAWKIERHSGVRLGLTDWQQRHPILAAPRILWRLWRRGVVR